ncbi:hypothetical protein [Mesoterricola sediminis]|uniref:Uncharacterized protein n=1 Tax=Mesoterricola sediminis TaxID=2927980 RepID=A0AA48GMJ6_9BACT|nr:hypothetical protein [Mesoterricola sediminis]BDU75836.1 hypothetical protein METESE_07940 [Mesoterricola sediminis]
MTRRALLLALGSALALQILRRLGGEPSPPASEPAPPAPKPRIGPPLLSVKRHA